MKYDVTVRPKVAGEIVVDQTHMARRASGIERVTRELFSREALAPLPSRRTPGVQPAVHDLQPNDHQSGPRGDASA